MTLIGFLVKNLPEVVLKMDYVILHQILKSRRFGFTDSFKGDVLQAVLGAAIVHLVGVRGRHHMQQVKVVCSP